MALAPVAGTPARVTVPLGMRLKRWLSAWLPLVLMALVAAGSWWLVKNTPLLGGPVETAPARHDPDYTMRNFELNRMGPDGRLRLRVEGQALRHFPDTDTLEIDEARVRAFGPDGRLIVATAKRAVSNGDGSEMQLIGDVLVRSFDASMPESGTPKLTVSGDFLQAESQGQVLKSHLPVHIVMPGSDMRVPNFEYQHLAGKLSFGGQARGQFINRARPAAPSP
jgi:lipopolysaccharide export system protein LptC